MDVLQCDQTLESRKKLWFILGIKLYSAEVNNLKHYICNTSTK